MKKGKEQLNLASLTLYHTKRKTFTRWVVSESIVRNLQNKKVKRLLMTGEEIDLQQYLPYLRRRGCVTYKHSNVAIGVGKGIL